MKEILDLITGHGFATVALVALMIIVYRNYKQIINWLWATIQAAAIIKDHERTIEELKEEIKILRQKLEEQNELINKQSVTLARLEERLIIIAKERVKSKIEGQDEI